MSSINLVNLNDAVHLILNRKFDWLSGVDIENFNKTNCPLLHQRDRNEVVTYKDWVSILAGNRDILDTYSNRKSRCLALSEYANYTTAYRPWGKTFGKYKGPNGKPLAEVMPLDEMFWYYDSLNRQLRTTIEDVKNDCRITYFYYNTDGWRFYWAEDGIAGNTQGYHTLQPGCYGIISAAYSTGNYCGWTILDETGPIKGEQRFIQTYSNSDVWKFQNAIFFVDSPIQIKAWWSGGTYTIIQGLIFRITPPGYWTA